jgi:hypothetical protein
MGGSHRVQHGYRWAFGWFTLPAEAGQSGMNVLSGVNFPNA